MEATEIAGTTLEAIMSSRVNFGDAASQGKRNPRALAGTHKEPGDYVA